MNPSFIFCFSTLLLFIGQAGYSQEKYPLAKPTEKPGVVSSPYGKNRFLDVEDLSPGSLAKDPVAGKVFRIPFPELSKIPVPAETETPQIAHQIPSSELDPGIQSASGLPLPPQKKPAIKAPIPVPGPDSPPRDLVAFIHSFNKASSVNDPGALAPFYANLVDNYFGDRNVSHVTIHKDRVAYINRFPERDYTLLEEPILISSDGNNFEVVTRIAYQTRGNTGERSGSVTDRITIRQSSRGYKITSINEAKKKPTPNRIPTQIGAGVVTNEIEQIGRFIEAYVESGDSNDPAANVNFMHSRVENYYGSRNLNRSALLRDRRNYINRWPERHYWLADQPQIRPLGSGSFEIVSNIGYDVRNGSKNASGTTTSIARVINTPGGYRIVSVRER